ncbi:MAG: hypothetical protein JOY93_01895 [Acidobacteriales bacterium]|nr:hypothetical protein [Terriglobales bacterium]
MTLRALGNAGAAASLIFGLLFFNYTGVLIAATSIPVWNLNAGNLPLHFGASGTGAAAGMLELLGHDDSAALQVLALGAAAIECWEGLRTEIDHRPAIDPLKSGVSGTIVRAGGILSGPVPLALRAFSLFGHKRQSRKYRRWAGAASLLGSLLTRFGWIHAGHVSARDWRLPLGIGHPER